MKSAVIKRSIVVSGHKTSVSLEDAFWEGMREIAREQDVTISNLVGEIDRSRQQSNLSSAIRVFVFERLRTPAPRSAGHAQESIENGTALLPLTRSSAA
jgi:predicted DNA-binding ribbon-helix-helix protein